MYVDNDRAMDLYHRCRVLHVLTQKATAAKRFKQNAVQYVQILLSREWEWLFLMQHCHRLGCWIGLESPLGLYFAVTEFKRRGPLWCLTSSGTWGRQANIKSGSQYGDTYCMPRWPALKVSVVKRLSVPIP